MLDLVIRSGLIVDGTGAEPVVGDVAIRAGRVVAVGRVDESARREVVADGALVVPGFVDPHTHYDAQLFWDGCALPSLDHGVTSVIGGNCGFTLAPLADGDVEYTLRMMSRVEGMPVEALRDGVDWSWETFGEYLDALEGRIGINAGFLVGHCALRRYVMGPAALEREATADELAQMVKVLDESLVAGGLGFSTSRSGSHTDGDDRPVASRLASEDEVLALCAAVGGHDGTSLEAIVQGCLTGFDEAEISLLARMSAAAGRPVNWNVLTVLADDEPGALRQLLPSDVARAQGGRVVALTMPMAAEMTMSFGTYCFLWQLPGWGDVLGLAFDEKVERLRDPAVRADLKRGAEQSRFAYLGDFENYRIGDTVSPANAGLEGRRVGDVAAERGLEPFDCLVDIVLEDDLATVLWPVRTETERDWELRRRLWAHEDVLLGGSDAGAHLDRRLAAHYQAYVVRDALRGRQLLSLPRAVQLVTSVPANLFGLRDRGVLRPGAWADVAVIDPDELGSEPIRRVADLPGGGVRLACRSKGFVRVLVNGVEAIVDGEATGQMAGTVLRSGRDTDTVSTR